MRRRDLIAAFGLAAIWLLAAPPQAQTTPRIAIVAQASSVGELSESGRWRAFFAELQHRGLIEGQTIAIDRYSAMGQRISDYRVLAQSVIARKPDVIVTNGNNLAAAFKDATRNIPILVFAADPVAFGLVSSLSRPGGNISGVSVDPGVEIYGKRIEVLKEALPTLTRVGFLGLSVGWERLEGPAMRDAAKRIGLELTPALLSDAADDAEYGRAFDAFAQAGVGAIVVSGVPQNINHRTLIIDLARSRALPAIYPFRDYAELGGLLVYGFDLDENFRRLAVELDEILKGAKPAEIPVTQPTKVMFVVNLKSAKALGITIPSAVVARADAVIE